MFTYIDWAELPLRVFNIYFCLIVKQNWPESLGYVAISRVEFQEAIKILTGIYG